MAKRTGIDIATLVTGVLMLILTLCLCGTSIATLGLTYIDGTAAAIQLCVAGWYLITSILAIAAGASGHKCPYVSSIVITILAILISVAATVVAACVAWSSLFELGQATTIVPDIEHIHEKWHEYIDYNEQTREFISSLPVGAVIINGISFILLIVISALSCCGTCCNRTQTPAPPQTLVASSAGYTSLSTPPSYASAQPPPPQDFHGIANPTYGKQPVPTVVA